MILVDTSVWIDHLRSGNETLSRLLEAGAVLTHPWVIGELALGRLRRRDEVIDLLAGLPQAPSATPGEVLTFIDRNELYGSGIGYVDVQLLAATKLSAAARLWSADRRLVAATMRLECAFVPGARDPAAG